MHKKTSIIMRASGLIAMFSIVIVSAVLFNRHHNERSERKRCKANLEHLGLAFMNYHDVYKSYPPASIVDSHGRPMHSWRVLVLPFVVSNLIYDGYQFDQAWNGPDNQQFLRSRYIQYMGTTRDITDARSSYQCPSAPESQSKYATNYVMIVDESDPLVKVWVPGGWPHDWRGRMPAGGKLMVVEIRDSNIHWMQPRDLSLDEMSFMINSSSKWGISSNHIGGAFVLMTDGTVEFLDEETTKEQLRQMLRAREREGE